MIRVHNHRQELDTPIVLTTINCDGIYRYWNADSMEEFHRWWWDKEYDGPAAEDEVTELFVNGYRVNGVETFDDITVKYGFDEEVEAGDLKFEIDMSETGFEYADWSLCK